MRINKSATGFVYLARSDGGAWKIGWSLNPEERMRTISGGQPYTVTLVHQVETCHATWLEGFLHKRFEARRIQGEWFRLEADDVAFIRELTTERVSELREQAGMLLAKRRKEERLQQQKEDEQQRESMWRSFAERLTSLRQSAGLSQYALANLTGISKQALSRLELSERCPGWNTVQLLALALGVSTEEFRDPNMKLPESRKEAG